MEVFKMLPNDFIKQAMQNTSTTQSDLAAALGYATQSAISSKLKASKLDTVAFIQMLNAMQYKIIAIDPDGVSTEITAN